MAATLSPPSAASGTANDNIRRFTAPSRPRSPPPQHTLFHPKTRAFVYGLQPKASQGMLDFDFICMTRIRVPYLTGVSVFEGPILMVRCRQAFDSQCGGHHLPLRWSVRVQDVLGDFGDSPPGLPGG